MDRINILLFCIYVIFQCNIIFWFTEWFWGVYDLLNSIINAIIIKLINFRNCFKNWHIASAASRTLKWGLFLRFIIFYYYFQHIVTDSIPCSLHDVIDFDDLFQFLSLDIKLNILLIKELPSTRKAVFVNTDLFPANCCPMMANRNIHLAIPLASLLFDKKGSAVVFTLQYHEPAYHLARKARPWYSPCSTISQLTIWQEMLARGQTYFFLRFMIQ